MSAKRKNKACSDKVPSEHAQGLIHAKIEGDKGRRNHSKPSSAEVGMHLDVGGCPPVQLEEN